LFNKFKDVSYQYQPKKILKRPDVVLRAQNRENIIERTFSCSLPKRLGCGFNEECAKILNEEIHKWVLSTSKITYRLSLIFNRLLLYLMSNQLDIPKFEDAFFNGLALHGMKERNKQSKLGFSSLINDFCDNEFNSDWNQYPKIERQKGDCQAIKIASSLYKTNFKNTIHVPFLIRQEKYIKVWVRVNELELEKRILRKIQAQINGWIPLEPIAPEIDTFVLDERRLLGEPNNVDTTWLQKNINVVLHYYYHILEYYTLKEQGNKFRLAPLCQIKRHFLTIDTVILRSILMNVRKVAEEKMVEFPDWMTIQIEKKEMTDDVWKSVFNYEGLKRRMRFSHMVNTDGVKVCFHFQVTKKKIRLRNKRRRRRCKEKQNKKCNNGGQRIIAIDPGRVNLIMAYDTEQDKYYRLTRNYYYRATGMKALTKRKNEENLVLKGVYEAMSRTPTKSIKEKDWYDYQQIVVRHYDKLWSLNATKKRSQEHFRVVRLKEKCLDRFFDQFLIKGQRKPLVVYGASRFNPTGKGEMSVPVRYVYEKCKQKYRTVKEDEKYTTIKHNKCKRITTALKVDLKYTRGLRWCSTCSELVSRDRNACLNIACCYQEETRPAYLCDTGLRGGRRRKNELKGCNHIHQR